MKTFDIFPKSIKNEYGIIEIQTRSFDKMRKKLEKLLENNEITIVYQIIVNKKIVYTDENEEKVRISPVHKTIFSAFKELYKIKTLLNSKNLHFHFVYLETAEIKKGNRINKYKQIKKKTIDSIPLKILKEENFDSYLDFARIFDSFEDTFTAKSIAALKKAKREEVQVCMTVLNYLGVIKHIDTIKREYVYKLND